MTFYGGMPPEERLLLAYRIVREELSRERARYAVLRAGRALRRHLGKVAPRDPAVFIDDLKTIESFRVDGHTWRIKEIEKQASKGLTRIHFVRID